MSVTPGRVVSLLQRGRKYKRPGFPKRVSGGSGGAWRLRWTTRCSWQPRDFTSV